MIEEFKDCEFENEKLRGEAKEKDEELRALRRQLMSAEQRASEVEVNDEEELDQMKAKVRKLQDDNAYMQKQQARRIKELEDKFEHLFDEHGKLKEEKEELSAQLKEKGAEVKQLERARDNFKDQCYDLKQEIKGFKQQLSANKENLQQVEAQKKQQQKSMVLSDIKQLIKDYRQSSH